MGSFPETCNDPHEMVMGQLGRYIINNFGQICQIPVWRLCPTLVSLQVFLPFSRLLLCFLRRTTHNTFNMKFVCELSFP